MNISHQCDSGRVAQITHNNASTRGYVDETNVEKCVRSFPWHTHWEQAMKQQVTLTRKAIKTPRAAAVAGIIFAVLFTISMVLMRLALPEELGGTNAAAWVQGNATTVTLALTLVPFAGIAFLWFIGVVRDRLGSMEDQFFSTVFFGSGLLFLAMVFASAAIAGGILEGYAIEPDTLTNSGVLTFGRAVMYTIANVYAIRMAAVFMIALATIPDAYACDAARVCVPHLPVGIGTAGEQQRHSLVDAGLSGLGVCDQRVHPDRQSTW